jgi:hypothetical protein
MQYNASLQKGHRVLRITGQGHRYDISTNITKHYFFQYKRKKKNACQNMFAKSYRILQFLYFVGRELLRTPSRLTNTSKYHSSQYHVKDFKILRQEILLKLKLNAAISYILTKMNTAISYIPTKMNTAISYILTKTNAAISYILTKTNTSISYILTKTNTAIYSDQNECGHFNGRTTIYILL